MFCFPMAVAHTSLKLDCKQYTRTVRHGVTRTFNTNIVELLYSERQNAKGFLIRLFKQATR